MFVDNKKWPFGSQEWPAFVKEMVYMHVGFLGTRQPLKVKGQQLSTLAFWTFQRPQRQRWKDEVRRGDMRPSNFLHSSEEGICFCLHDWMSVTQEEKVFYWWIHCNHLHSSMQRKNFLGIKLNEVMLGPQTSFSVCNLQHLQRIWQNLLKQCLEKILNVHTWQSFAQGEDNNVQ